MTDDIFELLLLLHLQNGDSDKEIENSWWYKQYERELHETDN